MDHVFADVTVAKKLDHISASTIESLIRWKNSSVCTSSTPCRARGKKCAQCSRLSHNLVKTYHGFGNNVKKMKPEEAKMEVGLRLVYEAMFGVVTVECIVNGKWFYAWRDAGHSTRIRRAWKRASGAPSVMQWIGSPSPKV
jgi:hypothetical protein